MLIQPSDEDNKLQGGKHDTKLLEILLQFRSKVRSTCITELKTLRKARKTRTKAASVPSTSGTATTTTAASSSTVSGVVAGQVASLSPSQGGSVSASASDTESVEQALSGLLKACDDVRDVDLASLGVRVEDVSEQASSWGVR